MSDLIVSSGGVSVGEEDHVKPAVEAEGGIDMWQIAIKPGKPLAYGFVNTVAEFSTHPALRRVEVGTPNGPVAIAAPPALLSDGPRVLGPVPAIGADSKAIRAEFAA